ncbi:MAG: RloB domain-containing protein [Candidatus Omnitrophota bacterium]|nr:RloB family protein [Patescibacteria group bacterium]MBU1923162.1 RloB family protein [Candidatus Omnitrophota bacterium]
MSAKKIKSTKYTKTTILIVGEGQTEKAFLQYLKELYVTRESDFVIKVECGSGGGPKGVVQKTVRLRSSRAYDRCFVLVDSDRPLETDSKLEERMHKKPPIEILKSTPCIEGLFLAILQHPNFSQKNALSDNCKREFEINYISDDKKTDKRSYVDRFTREILDERRKNIQELDAILKAMQV